MEVQKENSLIIGKPYIEITGDKAYLKSEIIEDDKRYVLYFGVDKSFKDGLCTELADCFLAAVFTHAMIEKKDIISVAPISRHLLYSVKTRIITQLSKRYKRYNSINIDAEPSDIVFDTHAVGTGWSAGVDCLYTFINNRSCEEPNHRITHLVNINAGVYEGSNERIYSQFQESSIMVEQAAKEFNLKSIDIDTNIHLIYDELYLSVVAQRICSAVLALQKLFRIYYFSSTYDVTSFDYDENNSGYYEFAVCSCFSTQNVKIFDYGSEVTRIEKVKQIADSKIAHEHLHTCLKNINTNCISCGKCIKTMASLYALGKLDDFNKVYDVERFKENIDIYIGDIYYNRSGKLYNEVWELLNSKGYAISKKSMQYAHFLNAAKQLAEKNKDKLL